MIRKKQGIDRVIDLTGPDGNAHVLMGIATTTAKQLNWSNEKIQDLMDEMKSSDYEHLIQVFDREFGWLYILER